MGHDPLRHFTAELHSLSAGVIGVHADAGQDDAVWSYTFASRRLVRRSTSSTVMVSGSSIWTDP